MTEASPIVFLSNADESEHKSLTTVGQVLDHSEVSAEMGADDERKQNAGGTVRLKARGIPSLGKFDRG